MLAGRSIEWNILERLWVFSSSQKIDPFGLTRGSMCYPKVLYKMEGVVRLDIGNPDKEVFIKTFFDNLRERIENLTKTHFRPVFP